MLSSLRTDAPNPLPWRRPRAELVLLLLVAVVALSPVAPYDEQDSSRVCLAHALLHGRLSDDTCFAYTVDSSRYGGHLYSNKAPGMSVAEILPAEAVRLDSPEKWTHFPNLRLWALHVIVSGIPFLLCVFLVGRMAEGLAVGTGAPVMVAFGLGTLLAPLAAAGFSHALAAGLGFGAFALAWSRRPLGAGLAAGAALMTEYQSAAILLILLAYTALQGRRAVRRYLAGAAPGVVLLAGYDWAAFGAPWHTPLNYSNSYADDVNSGLLGIHLPNLAATRLVFVGERGLLVDSPILVLAAVGLVLLWRRGIRAEALTCIAVTAAYAIAECGYFIPYGGLSPGPRFLAPALPFLAVGLGLSFARWRAVSTIVAALSVIATTAVTLTWPLVDHYRNTIWGELGRLVLGRANDLSPSAVPEDILTWHLGAPTVAAVAVVTATAFAIGMFAGGRRMEAS